MKEYFGDNPDASYVEKYNKEKQPFPFPHTPNNEELETVANYVLYGKCSTSDEHFDLSDPKGKGRAMSVVDAGYIEIEAKGSPWQRKQEKSLDGMMEEASQTGSPIEGQYGLTGNISGKTEAKVRVRIKKEVFSREEARLALCPDISDEYLCEPSEANATIRVVDGKSPQIKYYNLPSGNDTFLLGQFEKLWHSIDLTEYTVTSYELLKRKRDLPIREELEHRLTIEEKANASARANDLNMYTWSKLRRTLIELRQQQYSVRDSYLQTSMARQSVHYSEPRSNSKFNFAAVLPCGVHGSNKFSKMIFAKRISDEHFEGEFQKKLIKFLIEQDKEIEKQEGQSGVFDFRNLEHIALFIYAKNWLSDEDTFENNEFLDQVQRTMEYYIEVAHLEPLHRDIIEMKSNGSTNDTIAAHINKTYNKTYSANYISTIFRAKCCGGIASAASQHWEIVDKLSLGREEFKLCNTCGKLLLRDSNNFVKKTRASDGFAGRCKVCDKAHRQVRSKVE